MKIKNEIEDNVLGKIFCVATDDGSLLGWVKGYPNESNMELLIYLDLYCVDVNFEFEECDTDDLVQLKNGIKQNLDRLESSKNTLLRDIAETFYDQRNFHGYEEKVKENQILIEEIRVFEDNYSVIFSVKSIDEVFAYEVYQDRKSINYEDQSEVVSMVY